MESSVKDLSKYRFENSLENLEDARIMFENGRYKNALNRAYYSIFHGIRSVCALRCLRGEEVDHLGNVIKFAL